MIILEHNNKEYKLKNKISELTIEEFEVLGNLFEKPEYNVYKWVKMISYLTGIDEDIINDWSKNKFQSLVDMMFVNDNDGKAVKSKTINGVKHIVNSNVTARELSVLEKILLQYKEHKVSMLIAVRFKDPSLSNKENLDINVIKKRAEFIRNLPTKGLLPLLESSVIEFVDYLKASSTVQ